MSKRKSLSVTTNRIFRPNSDPLKNRPEPLIREMRKDTRNRIVRRKRRTMRRRRRRKRRRRKGKR
jgi:hypothetical protein